MSMDWTTHFHICLLITRGFGAQESNRAYCVQFSLFLAGLLNRTLLFVEDPVFNGRKIDRHIFFDHLHTRQCYGPDAVSTVGEYIQKHGHPPVIDQIRLLAPHPSLVLPNVTGGGDPMLMRSIRSSVETNDATVKPGLQIERVNVPRRGGRYVSIESIVHEYGNLTSSVLFMGEGFFLRQNTEVPKAGMDRAHLPFKRLPGCPNDLDVQPHPAIFVVADLVTQNTPGLQEKYVALHMRLGDFIAYHTYHTPTQYAEDVSKVLLATGLRSLFLATNGSPAEVGAPVGFRVGWHAGVQEISRWRREE